MYGHPDNGLGWVAITRHERARRMRQRLTLWVTSAAVATGFLVALALLERAA